MRKTTAQWIMMLALVICVTSEAAAEITRIEGMAAAVQSVERVRNRRSATETLVVPVTIDLTNVFVNGHSPILGAYVARIEFDPSMVAYVAAEGGSSSYFSKTPFATQAQKANVEGIVRLAYVQTDALAPSGVVNVARVIFRELQKGGAATIKVHLDSVASALEKSQDGTFLGSLKIAVEPQHRAE